MYFDRGSMSMDAKMERKIARHPRASGDPVQRYPLNSRVRGNDYLLGSPVCLHSRVQNTL
jgi:hypothetical protein